MNTQEQGRAVRNLAASARDLTEQELADEIGKLCWETAFWFRGLPEETLMERSNKLTPDEEKGTNE